MGSPLPPARPRARGRRLLVVTAVVAIGLPVGAAWWVDARTADLAAHLTAAGGVPVRLGGVDADLTGAVRLSDIAFGDLASAEAIEASVALDSLISGQIRADEIRVAAPRLDVRVGPDGDSDLLRLVRRLARRGGGSGRSAGGRLRRIVVSSGSLRAHVDGLGDVTASGVELVPDEDGVRVITGQVRVHAAQAALALDLVFARSAAELVLPQLAFRRMLAVGGTGELRSGSHAIPLREVAAGRLTTTGGYEVHASIDDAGIPRAVSLELQPSLGTVTLEGADLPLAALAALAPSGLALEGGHASGTIHARRAGRALELVLDLDVDGVAIDSRALAAERVPVTGTVRTTLSIAPEAVAVHELALDAGAIHARASGWLRRGSPISGQVEVALTRAPCAELLASLPEQLRGPLDGMVLEGTVGGAARLTLDLAAPVGEGVTLATTLDGGCTTLAEPPAADVMSLVTPTDHAFPDGSVARVGPGELTWVPFEQIPTRLKGAFVSAEDGRFWDHPGFDLAQIARSLEIDLREKRLARGGSTISQQLIKNSFLTHRRSLDRKLQEAILTWRLEARLDKKQILTRYLNIIELGPRVFGLRAAARFWFDASPRELTTRQLAFLAAITSEPTSMSRRVRRHGGLDPDSAARVATILRAMRRDGVIGEDDFELARLSPMGFAPAALRTDEP